MPEFPTNLEPVHNVELTAFKESVRQQFSAITEATKLVREEYNQVPTRIDRAIDGLRDLMEAQIGEVKAVSNGTERTVAQLEKLHEEKFRSVATQFSERDTRQTTSEASGKTAIENALTSIKESMDKTEKNFEARLASGSKAYDDLKERVVAMESRGKAGTDIYGYILGGVMALALVADLIIRR